MSVSRRRLRKERTIPYSPQTVDHLTDRQEAKEQETCEIVYFARLLKSIKQGSPLAAERYRVWRERAMKGPNTEGNKTKTVGKGSKKRKLEDDVGKEKGGGEGIYTFVMAFFEDTNMQLELS